MKLLLDHNLSHRLVPTLHTTFGHCEHVRNLKLHTVPDTQVWNYARENAYIIVSKDADFYNRSVTIGAPPKIIWIRRGNCSTSAMLQTLLDHSKTIKQFAMDTEASFLTIP